jgi:integrase
VVIAKVAKAYRYILKNYVVPQWGAYALGAVKAVAVESWLKSIDKANGTKAKIREVFGAAFRHAMRHELHLSNPIANARQVRKRATDPSILEPAEIAAILHKLEGVEPVRTAFLIAAVMGWKAKSSYIKPENWVFASEISLGKQPLWPGTLWRRNVAPAIQAAGIDKPRLGWHTLRRTFASLLLSSGASLRVSMELMRHSTAEMTLATYAQTVGDEKREAGKKVASLVLVKKENAA